MESNRIISRALFSSLEMKNSALIFGKSLLQVVDLREVKFNNYFDTVLNSHEQQVEGDRSGCAHWSIWITLITASDSYWTQLFAVRTDMIARLAVYVSYRWLVVAAYITCHMSILVCGAELTTMDWGLLLGLPMIDDWIWIHVVCSRSWDGCSRPANVRTLNMFEIWN